jgi:hypothetical protein
MITGLLRQFLKISMNKWPRGRFFSPHTSNYPEIDELLNLLNYLCHHSDAPPPHTVPEHETTKSIIK